MMTVFYSTCPDTHEALRRLKKYAQPRLTGMHNYNEVYNGRPDGTIVFIYDDIDRPQSISFCTFFNCIDSAVKICVDTFETRDFVGAL